MKKVITIILICFSLCSCGQTLQNAFNNSGLTPTIKGHTKPLAIYNLSSYDLEVKDSIARANSILSIYPAYYSQSNSQFITDSTIQSSSVEIGAGYITEFAYTNTTPFNYFLHTLYITPFYIKLQANHFDTEPVKILAHLPTFETINNIVTLDHDTLKVVYLTTPLTVETFKTLITQK